MSVHYVVKYERKKWCQSEMCIVINNESQGSIAKNIRNDELLYFIFFTQSAGERIFIICEHLAKLQAKRCSFDSFDLGLLTDLCHQ